MAKKKKDENWEKSMPEVESNFDATFEDITDTAKRRFVGAVYSGGEEEAKVVCLPVPAFSVRFLFQQEGWPLSRFNMLLGPQESFKSALAVEVVRWHRKQKGNGVKINTEFKPAPELQSSILEWDMKALKSHSCAKLEEWQKALDFWIGRTTQVMDGYKEDGKKIPGVGRRFPVAFIVDSMTAVLDEKLYDKMEKEGTASRHFSTQAAYITDYMKYLPTKLDGYPFSYIGINHLKDKQDDMGNVVRSVPGGKGLLYHETMELEVRRGAKINRVDEKGIVVKLEVIKNALAPHERMSVEVLWHIDLDDKDPITGNPRQKTIFDWHSASIEVLHGLMGGAAHQINKIGTKQARLIKEATELHISTENRTAWSKVLGISEKKPLDWRDVGIVLEEKLQSDKEFRDALYPITGIRRRNMFIGGTDYWEQQQKALAAAVAINQGTEMPLPFADTPFASPNGGVLE